MSVLSIHEMSQYGDEERRYVWLDIEIRLPDNVRSKVSLVILYNLPVDLEASERKSVKDN